jgi:hypothetical protein
MPGGLLLPLILFIFLFLVLEGPTSPDVATIHATHSRARSAPKKGLDGQALAHRGQPKGLRTSVENHALRAVRARKLNLLGLAGSLVKFPAILMEDVPARCHRKVLVSANDFAAVHAAVLVAADPQERHNVVPDKVLRNIDDDHGVHLCRLCDVGVVSVV